jgi:hypothetical protein
MPSYQDRRAVSEDYTQVPTDYGRAPGPSYSNHSLQGQRAVSDGQAHHASQSNYASSVVDDPEIVGDLLNGIGDDAYDPSMDAPKQFRTQQRAQVLPLRQPMQPPNRAQPQQQPINISLDGSNRLVIAIDFGTTYTGMATMRASILQMN